MSFPFINDWCGRAQPAASGPRPGGSVLYKKTGWIWKTIWKPITVEAFYDIYRYEKIQIEIPNNRETMPQTDIWYHQVKPPLPGMGYILLSCWPKRSHKKQTDKHYWLLPRLFVTLHYPLVRSYCWRYHLFMFLNHREVKLVSNQKLHPYWLALTLLEGTLDR